MNDRRFSAASVQVHGGGLAAAYEFYSDNTTPDVLVVSSQEEGQGLLDGVDRLAEVCDPKTRVVVIGASNEISLYRTLIRRGVSDYIAQPLDGNEVIRVILEACTGSSEGESGRMVAFTAAKGGAGSSTVAGNTAWTIADQYDIDVALVDLDMSFGTAGLAFNLASNQGLGSALADRDRLDDVLLDRYMPKYNDHLALLTAPASLTEFSEIDADGLSMVLNLVREKWPIVILDVPHIWSPWTRQILLEADHVVITALPDLASLRHSKNLVELLRGELGEDASVTLVLNHVGEARKVELSTRDFRDGVDMEPAIVLPNDPALFGTAANNGQMIGETQKNNKVVESFQQLALTVSGRRPAKEETSGISWFKRFKK